MIDARKALRALLIGRASPDIRFVIFQENNERRASSCFLEVMRRADHTLSTSKETPAASSQPSASRAQCNYPATRKRRLDRSTNPMLETKQLKAFQFILLSHFHQRTFLKAWRIYRTSREERSPATRTCFLLATRTYADMLHTK